MDEKGEIRKFINIYVDEEDIRFLQGKNTKIKDKKEITIVPAIAGGWSCKEEDKNGKEGIKSDISEKAD